MGTGALRRWLGVATITGTLLLLPATPDLASAATQPSTTGTITPYLNAIALPPGGDIVSGSEVVGLAVSSGLAIPQVDNLTVTLDTSELPAGATLSIVFASNVQCTTSTHSVVCSASTSLPLNYAVAANFFYVNAQLFIDVRAAAGASYGLGSLTVSATANGLAGASTTVPVEIAEPVKLAVDPITSVSGPPGSTYSQQWTVANAGTTTVHRATLWIESGAGFDLAKHYSNCRYYLPSAAVCTFDNDLAPGVTYEVSEPVTVQVAADHVAPFLGATEVQWITPLDLSTFSIPSGTPGTDGPLGLVVKSTQAPAPPLTRPDLSQTDPNGLGNTRTDVTVSGVNPADLAAIGTSVPGPVWGGPVSITVRVFNQGPAAASMSRTGDPITEATVTLPTGTTATAVPLQCAPDVSGQPDWRHPGQPGSGQYDCAVYQNLAVQQNYALPFTVQVPPTSAPLHGSVTITDAANPAGNTASIVITPQILGRTHGTPDPTPIPRR